MKTEYDSLIEAVIKTNPDFNPDLYDFNNRAVYSANDPDSVGASLLSIYNREEEKSELFAFERRVLDFHRTAETDVDDYVSRNSAAMDTFARIVEDQQFTIGDANYTISSAMDKDVLVVTYKVNTLVLIGKVVVRVSYVEPPEGVESDDEPTTESDFISAEEDE